MIGEFVSNTGIGLYGQELTGLRFKRKPAYGVTGIFDQALNSPETTREQRKGLLRSRRLIESASKKPLTTLISVNEALVDEEDENFLSRFFKDYSTAFTRASLNLQLVRVLNRLGVSETDLRQIGLDGFTSPQVIQYTMSQVGQARTSENRAYLTNLLNSLWSIKNYYTDEDDEFLTLRMQEETTPLFDLLNEDLRIRGENVALLGMQIDWLKSRRRATKKAARKAKEETRVEQSAPKIKPKIKIDESPQTPDPATDLKIEITTELPSSGQLLKTPLDPENANFPNLTQWGVFWTTRPFSYNPNHLVEVPTNSITQAARLLRRVGEGAISISTLSILASLEFHLGKNVIQRALGLRNKYAPEEIRDWVKLKRGKDRIHLFIPPDHKQTVIFFAAGRDVVYRAIR